MFRPSHSFSGRAMAGPARAALAGHRMGEEVFPIPDKPTDLGDNGARPISVVFAWRRALLSDGAPWPAGALQNARIQLLVKPWDGIAMILMIDNYD